MMDFLDMIQIHKLIPYRNKKVKKKVNLLYNKPLL